MNYVSISWKSEKALETLSTTIYRIGTIILDARSSDITLANRNIKQAQTIVPISTAARSSYANRKKNPQRIRTMPVRRRYFRSNEPKLASRNEQQIQTMEPTKHVPTIDDVKLILRDTVKTCGDDIACCSLLSDGRMIFSCYSSNKMYVIRSDGVLDFTFKSGTRTSHLHYIEESNKLVVTSGFDYTCIKVINMINRKTEKVIDVGSENYGIVHKDGKLFYNGHYAGISFVSLDNGSVTRLVFGTLHRYSSIAMWSDYLYFINENDSVTCCDIQGAFRWKSKLNGFLKDARGITVDTKGYVYVSGFLSNNVVRISPDGAKHKLLISEEKGLNRPQAM
ncbi:Hypothetical predicted protein [Mytilus galloprovincialis]|uniref:Uncharacterized protein n=1 Tax=Mytilus galloprovincialis TaxID=29158 RepID=A0A8B6E1T9_MYTGA|nr:Hypothetical predicted protein [Mytilus galloprovincialis]